MIKNNKWKVLISSLIMLRPLFAGIILWDKIPSRVGSKPVVVFGLPIFCLALHLGGLFLTSLDKKQADQSKKALEIVFWIIPFLSLLAESFLYGTAFGKKFRPFSFLPAMLGIMFVFIGNYLPKTKQNRTLGIKISWTLNNEENWNKTHRFAGKIWVICGLALCFCVFLPDPVIPLVSCCAILAAVAAPIVFSYRLYRKHRKEGVSYAPQPRSRAETYFARAAVFAVPVILIGAGALMFTGDIGIYCTESSLRVEASYWSDLEIDYAEIDGLQYRTDLDPGVRTNGFGSGRLLLGTFCNDEFGTYTRYTYTGSRDCIVLEADGETFVIGTKDTDEMKELYETLLKKSNG